MIHQTPSKAIAYAREKLYNMGSIIKQKTWQSVSSPDDTIELLNHVTSFPISFDKKELVKEIKPNEAWANEHFEERIGGAPLNPPPSHERWPYSVKSNIQFRDQEKFSHTYPERFWPKFVGHYGQSSLDLRPNMGIRFQYGDYDDVLTLLAHDQTTRQAYLPIWFPEDLNAAVNNKRVPCTLGYHFIIRNDMMHLNYYIRSCDIIRHYRDDIYLACLLVHHTMDIVEKMAAIKLVPGIFTMYITSLHCFVNDKPLLIKP